MNIETMNMKPSRLQNYKIFTRSTAIYPKEKFLEYLALGLVSESGEVAGVVKRTIRDNQSLEETKEKLAKELGDVLWYWVRLCDELDLSPEAIIIQNVRKLTSRMDKNTIQGYGDDR